MLSRSSIASIADGPRRVTRGEVEDRGQQQRDDDEDQQTRERPGLGAIEAQRLPPDRTDDDRDAQTEEAGTDDRSGDLRADDVGVAIEQHEERQDQLREAAEADVQQPADRGAEAVRELFGRPSHPVR